LSIDSATVLLIDPLAGERDHLIDDDLFLTSCLLTVTPEVKVLTSETSAANINSKHSGVAGKLKSFGMLRKISRLWSVARVAAIRSSGYSDVIFQSFEEPQAIVFMLLHPRTRVHLISTNNLSRDRSERHPLIWKWLIRMALKRATSIIVHSEYESDVVKAIAPSFDRDRIFIKPFHQVAANRSRPAWSERSNKIVFIGPILDRKPIEPVIELIERDTEQRFSYVLRRMEGLSPKHRSFLEKQPNVDISSGFVSDADYRELFSNAALVLKTHNRLFEGKLSGPFCDAIASSTPIVASDMSPHDEYFRRFGNMGFLVDYDDPTWSDAILTADLAVLYTNFRENMAKCRAESGLDGNRAVFESVLSTKVTQG